MHILIVPSEHFVTIDNPLAGIFQMHQARALSGAGFQVGVAGSGFKSPRRILSRYVYSAREIIDGVAVVRRYRPRIIPERLTPTPLLIRQTTRALRVTINHYISEFGIPDIIHAHNFLYGGIAATKIGATLGIPVVITEHSSLFLKHSAPIRARKFLRKASLDARSVIAVSRCLSNRILEVVGIPINISIINNVVASEFINHERCQDTPESGSPVFVSVGSLDRNKNHQFLLRAFASEFKSTSATLKIIGTGDLLSELVAYANDLGISDQVDFLGYLGSDDVIQVLDGATCFVLTSRLETFGVALIEALSRGLPLIATRCGGPEDIVNETNGILVDSDDDDALRLALSEMGRNFARFSTEEIRRSATKLYGEETLVRSLKQIYDECLIARRQ